MEYSFVTDFIDIEQRFLGNAELFTICIHKFAENYADAPVILQNFYLQYRHDDFNRYIHSLKGTAMTLGMSELCRLAQALEADINNHLPINEDKIRNLISCIENIIHEIHITTSAECRQ